MLVLNVSAGSEPKLPAAAAAFVLQAAALPAALAAADSSLTACMRAVSLASELFAADSLDVRMTDKALRVAEAAIAATQKHMIQVHQLASQVHMQKQLLQQVPFAMAAGRENADDDLADTCCSSSSTAAHRV
jgi:hypothetical protein